MGIGTVMSQGGIERGVVVLCEGMKVVKGGVGFPHM